MSIGARSRLIDVLRGVSILLVLAHHFNIAYSLRDTAVARVFGWEAVHAVVRNGNYGVTMFFVISGYLITSNAKRRWNRLGDVCARAFYGLRVARIAPCLLLLLAIVNGLALAGIPMFENRAPLGVPVPFWIVDLASLTFWMNVLIGARGWVNYALGVLWSLSVEEVFYLSFPVLCAGLRRESRLLAFWAIVAAVGPVYRSLHQGDEGGFLYAYFASFDGIAIGCGTALLADSIRWRCAARTAAQWLVAAAMALLYLRWPISQSNVFGVTAMALGTAVLLASESAPAADPDRHSGWLLGPLAAAGKISYELYLFHLVVLGLLRTSFAPQAASGNGKLMLLVIYFVLSATASALVARFYAEPANRGIRRRIVPAPVRTADA